MNQNAMMKQFKKIKKEVMREQEKINNTIKIQRRTGQ